MAKKIVHVSGKRKTAIARATVKEGKGVTKINNQLLDNYSPEIGKMMIKEPLIIASDVASKVDILVNVKGGGWHSQSEATRLAIARALVEFTNSKTLKKQFLDYDRHLIIADIRQRETRKPNTSKGARSKRQKSYR